MQTDNDISLWPGIINRTPQNCNLKSYLWGDVLPRTTSQVGLQIAVNDGSLGGGQSNLVKYTLLLLSCKVVSYSFMTSWSMAHQAPLFKDFPKEEYWSAGPLAEAIGRPHFLQPGPPVAHPAALEGIMGRP